MTRTRTIRAIALLAVLVLAAACGGGDSGGGDAVSAAPAQTTVTVTPANAATPFQLQAGRYRFAWDAPGCKAVDFALTGQAQGFTYSKKSNLPSFNAIVSDVPEDVYVLSQSAADCTTWSVTIDKM